MYQAVYTTIGIALATGVVLPLLRRYQAWKASPDRAIVARRNWRGHYVPDLTIKRAERAWWIFLVLFVIAGLVVNYVNAFG